MSNLSFDSILYKYSAVNTHFGTDKITSHSYGGVYSSLFSKYKHTESLLEIGFDGGASLLAYADYFKNATIYGIDIEDNRLDDIKNNPRIHTCIGDAKQSSIIHKFGKSYDIIIEDASHLLEDQIQHFKDYSSFVNPGGIYIIEDVAEVNKDSLEKALSSEAKQRGFDLCIYDLRNIKGRFDDILFVFQKQ